MVLWERATRSVSICKPLASTHMFWYLWLSRISTFTKKQTSRLAAALQSDAGGISEGILMIHLQSPRLRRFWTFSKTNRNWLIVWGLALVEIMGVVQDAHVLDIGQAAHSFIHSFIHSYLFMIILVMLGKRILSSTILFTIDNNAWNFFPWHYMYLSFQLTTGDDGGGKIASMK